MTRIKPSEPVRRGLVERLSDGVCRRAFSSPEAFLYELAIAPAVFRAVHPALAPRVEGELILDVGCGGGRLAQEIGAEGARSVIGIDSSHSQVRRFNKHAGPRRSLVALPATAQEMPFRSGTFDTVYSSCAWKHWPSPVAGIEECARVLRPDGQLVVVEIDGACTAADFAQFARTSRVPFGLRAAYVRFAMRTVVGVAPTAEELRASIESVVSSPPQVERVAGLPFLVAVATA